MHLPGEQHLLLRGIPVRIMGFCPLQLLQRVEMFPLVFLVFGKGLPGPLGQRPEGIVIAVVMNEIHAEFLPHDELFKICSGIHTACLPHLQGDIERRDLSEMKVRTHVREVVGCWIIPEIGESVQLTPGEFSKMFLGFRSPTSEGTCPSYASVYLELCHSAVDVIYVKGVKSDAERILSYPTAQPFRHIGSYVNFVVTDSG
jgi:hypothetical protein